MKKKEMLEIDNYQYERELKSQGVKIIAGYEEAGESGDAGYGQENSGARDCRKERYQCRTGGADLPAVSDTSGSEPGGDSGEDGIVRINCMIIYDYVI